MFDFREAPPEPLNAFVDEFRSHCLWFLREDYYPTTSAELLQILQHVERHGSVAAFRRAAALRQWLSRNTKNASAG